VFGFGTGAGAIFAVAGDVEDRSQLFLQRRALRISFSLPA
jgi:hypothetical protein